MKAVALVLLAALACAAPAPSSAQAQQRVVRSAQLDRAGEFRVWNLLGSVRVGVWDVDSVRVEATMDDAARGGFRFGASAASGKVAIDADHVAGRADFVIRVPRGATVWVKTMNGSVVVDAVEGAIDVHSVSGDVDIDAPARSVYAESMGGRVRVTGRARVVRLRSGSGRLEFDGTAADLSMTSIGGDILARASDLRRGILESVGGRVHVGAGLPPGAALEILTHDGDVDVTVQPSVSATFLLRTIAGAIRTDMEGPAARAARRGTAAREARFVAGRGAADVEVRTFSGDITIRTP